MAHRFLPDGEPAEVFYGGAAGGGKSDWILMGALEYVDVPGYAAIIFRRTFTDLALPGAIMARSHEWLDNSDAHWNAKKQWEFPSGAVLQFAFMDKAGDELRYQSAEFQFVGFDELTQFPESQYTYLFSRLRRPKTGPLGKVPLRMYAASNPGGIGHGWVKQRFPIDGRPRGRRIFIPAKIADNPHLDADAYRESLSRLGEVLRSQLERGDWDVAEGLAYHLDDETHLIAPIQIPDSWERDESMDFGVANPTCVLVGATDYDGNSIIFDSYYAGNRLVSDHARALEAKRKLWWPAGQTPVCWADPSMWARTGQMNRWGQPATDVTEFQEHGIGGLVQANNHRRPGRSRISEMLKPDPRRRFPGWHPRAGEYGAPRLFIVASTCPELVEQLQAAPLLPQESGREGAGEIVDPGWESQHGHAAAAMRYWAMARPGASDEPAPGDPDDPRQAHWQKANQREEDETLDPFADEEDLRFVRRL